MAGTVSMLGLAALVLVAGTSGAASALAPEPTPAGLVFSFGDRVARIAADGSDRRYLTSTGPFDRGDLEGRTGDANAQISPDGSRLLLTRFTPDGSYGVRDAIVLADADGRNPRRILHGNRRVTFSSPAWMPDGKSVAVARTVDRGRSTLRSVVIAGLDGKAVKTVFKLPPHRQGNLREDLRSYREPVDIAVSPDARKLLITVSDGYAYDRKWLMLVDLDSGRQRYVGKNTRHGSFSPDGNRFAYISSVDNRGATCTDTSETSCVIQGDLFVQTLDGSGKRRLTRSRAAEENPDWSPDGKRIAFDANYNLPRFGSASEIYAIAPDGSCLSWLTNGAPAGTEPDWAPDMGRSDLLCGVGSRKPVIFNQWRPVDRKQASISVWGGPVMGSRLVSEAILSGPIRFASYEDCAVFDARVCRPEPRFQISGFSTCFAGMYLGLEVAKAPASAFGQRRGVTFIRARERVRGGWKRQLTIFTGDAILWIVGSRNATFAQLERQIDELRPASADEPSGRLPSLHLPKGLPGTARAIARSVRRIGVTQTSRRIDESRATVRAIARFSKRLKLLGPIRTKNCTKEEVDPFAGF